LPFTDPERDNSLAELRAFRRLVDREHGGRPVDDADDAPGAPVVRPVDHDVRELVAALSQTRQAQRGRPFGGRVRYERVPADHAGAQPTDVHGDDRVVGHLRDLDADRVQPGDRGRGHPLERLRPPRRRLQLRGLLEQNLRALRIAGLLPHVRGPLERLGEGGAQGRVGGIGFPRPAQPRNRLVELPVGDQAPRLGLDRDRGLLLGVAAGPAEEREAARDCNGDERHTGRDVERQALAPALAAELGDHVLQRRALRGIPGQKPAHQLGQVRGNVVG
jgi:hypothetical protein